MRDSIIRTHFGGEVISRDITEFVAQTLNDLQLQHFQTDAGKREEFTQDFLRLMKDQGINFYQRETDDEPT